jgi:hypothetical protein
LHNVKENFITCLELSRHLAPPLEESTDAGMDRRGTSSISSAAGKSPFLRGSPGSNDILTPRSSTAPAGALFM